MHKLIHASLLICTLSGLSDAYAWPQAATSENGVPALKVTAPNGAENLLIGSLHIPADGLRQPSAAAFEGAMRYVVESVPNPAVKPKVLDFAPEIKTAAEAMKRAEANGEKGRFNLIMDIERGTIPGIAVRDGKPVLRANWAITLTESEVEQLYRNAGCDSGWRQVAAVTKTPVNRIVDMLLLLSNSASVGRIAASPCASEGLLSRDDLLARAASNKGLQPLPLETAEDVERQRSALPARILDFQLRQAFKPEYQQALQLTIDSLNTGDYDGVLQAVNSGTPDDADAKIFQQHMLSNRNHAWLPKLMTFMDKGKSVVNVGAGHLPGPDGVIALLRNQGYRIEPIMIPAGDGR